jgi:hypothetical protein
MIITCETCKNFLKYTNGNLPRHILENYGTCDKIFCSGQTHKRPKEDKYKYAEIVVDGEILTGDYTGHLEVHKDFACRLWELKEEGE